MIYEMRTYDLKPRTLPEFEKRFGEALPKRQSYSPLAAFWHTEIGPLNQVIHVWPYQDLAERERIRAAAAKDGVWPPPTLEFIDNMRSEIFMPFSVYRELGHFVFRHTPRFSGNVLLSGNVCVKYRTQVQVCFVSSDYDKPEFLKVGQISTARNFKLKSFLPR